MDRNSTIIKQSEQRIPLPPEPKLIGYDYAGREVFESDARIIFDGYIICDGDERDFLLTMGGDAVD